MDCEPPLLGRGGEEQTEEQNDFPALCQRMFVREISLCRTSKSGDAQGRAVFLDFMFLAVLGEGKVSRSQLYMIVY